MRVLFFHSNSPDYLADSLFHGLRSLIGNDCVDVPRYDSMYKPLTEQIRAKLRGHGFTLYGLLEDDPALIPVRYYWQSELTKYDLVVVSDIWRQWRLYQELRLVVRPERIAVIDGSDSPAWFPFSSRFATTPDAYFTYRSRSKYFKRELVGSGANLGHWTSALPKWIAGNIRLPRNAYPISFSIPEEKIFHDRGAQRITNFPRDIVDYEIVEDLGLSESRQRCYPFAIEEEYYADLRNARFGVTTKRAGWDCLRHYELAANGCVICFRDLDQKPGTCAPHGLNQDNAISYRDPKDLRSRIQSLSNAGWLALQKAGYDWISRNTTIARARDFLGAF
jgi:hypothetical protein